MDFQIPNLAKQKYSPANVCIYCGTRDDLRDEHIIPSCLGGKGILPKSTCGKCSTITSKMERFALRGSLRAVRIYLKLRSRRPNDVPSKYPIQIEKDNQTKTIKLPLEEYPVLLPLPIFNTPTFLSGEKTAQGIEVIGLDTISFGPNPEVIGKKLGVKVISITPEKDYPNEFARMLGKIAYAFATAEIGLDKIDEAFVLPAILGKIDDIGRWVGTIRRETQAIEGLLHRLKLSIMNEKRILLGEVQLFASSMGPTCGVVIGKYKAKPLL